MTFVSSRGPLHVPRPDHRPMPDHPATNGADAARPPGPFVKRVRLRNYKSIKSCDVELGPLTILVGRNGSGKSNFVDALRLLGELSYPSIQAVFHDRGGFGAVVRHGTAAGGSLLLGFDATTLAGNASFEIEIGEDPAFGPVIIRERAETEMGAYEVRRGVLDREGLRLPSYPAGPLPRSAQDRIYLLNMWAFSEFYPLLEILDSIAVYNFNTFDIRAVRTPRRWDSSFALDATGSNLVNVAARIASDDPSGWKRIVTVLSGIVPEVADVTVDEISDHRILRFREVIIGEQGSANGERTMTAAEMSDGTLRALAILVATYRLANGPDHVRLVGVEEPEAALHPAAAGVLMDALREAAVHRQVVVTTHSPDLVDLAEADEIRVVRMHAGATEIGPVDDVGRSVIRDQLYSPGELLRLDHLEPDPEKISSQNASHATPATGDVP